MEKKKYETPSLTVAMLCSQQQLMGGSKVSASGSGGFGFNSAGSWSGFGPNINGDDL